MARADVVGLAKQTAFGTKNVTPSYYIPVESADATTNAELLSIDETIGNRFGTDPDPGSRHYEIPLALAPRPTSFPRLLSMFLGAPAMTTPGGGTLSRDHTFDPVANSTLVWHSLLLGRDSPSPKITDLAYDAIGNELTLSCAPNEYLRAEANCIARKLDDPPPTFPVAPSIDASSKWKFDQVTVLMSVAGGGEAAFSCERVSATINNNVDTDFVVLGSPELYALAFVNADINLSFTVREALDTHYRRSLLATPTNCALRVLASGAIIEGALKYELEVTIPRFFYNPASVGISGSDIVKGIEIGGRGAYNSATSKAFGVRVRNTITTTY